MTLTGSSCPKDSTSSVLLTCTAKSENTISTSLAKPEDTISTSLLLNVLWYEKHDVTRCKQTENTKTCTKLPKVLSPGSHLPGQVSGSVSM